MPTALPAHHPVASQPQIGSVASGALPAQNYADSQPAAQALGPAAQGLALSPWTIAQAKLILGEQFFYGAPNVRQNYFAAIPPLQAAAEQNVNLKAQAQAQLRLGEIYGVGDKFIPIDFTKAIPHLLSAANQTHDLQIQAQAWLRLSEAYYLGDKTVQKDYSKALPYLLAAKNQIHCAWSRASAELRLGKLYLLGDTTMQKDYSKAEEHLKAAAGQALYLNSPQQKQDTLKILALLAQKRFDEACQMAQTPIKQMRT